jgi:hypothetical protein
MQMRANMQYEQGLSQIKNTYNSLFNQPVTGEEATMRQHEYARKAQEQMKDISAADVSDPKNQQIANQIMAPFYEDKGLVSNIAYTREIGQNVQKIQSGLFSKDEKERAMYDPVQLQDQEGYRQELAEAGVNTDKLARLNRRPVTPFHDIRTYLNDAAGKQGLNINWDQVSPDGQYIITTTNGQRALGDFKTFARTVLSDPALQGQFQTYGRVARDNAKRHVLQTNPNIAPADLNKQIADYTINEMDRTYKNNLSDYAVQSIGLQMQLDDIKAKATVIGKDGKPRLTEAAYAVYQQIQDYKNTIDESAKKLGTEYGMFTMNKDSKYDAIAADPTDYFAKLQRDNIVDNFAAEKASQEGRTIKTNQAYFDAWNARRADMDLSFRERQEVARENEFKIAHKYDKANMEVQGLAHGFRWNEQKGEWEQIPGWVSGKGGVGGGVPNAQLGTVNVDAQGFLHVPDQMEAYKGSIASTVTQAHNILWSPTDGMAASIVDTPINVDGTTSKLTIADLDLTKDALAKRGADSHYKYTPGELNALKRTGIAIGCTDFQDPQKMVEALESKVSTAEKNQDGTPTTQSQNLANKKAQADQLLQSANAKRKELDNLVSTNILSDPKGNADLLSDDKSRLVNREDMQGIYNKLGIGSIKFKDGTVITGQQLADAYYSGQFDYSRSFLTEDNLKYITINGRKLKMSDFLMADGEKNPDGTVKNFDIVEKGYFQAQHKPVVGVYDLVDDYMNKYRKQMEDRYGESSDFAEKRRRIGNSVVKQVQGFNETSGQRGVNIGFNSDAHPEQLNTKNYVAEQLSIPGNRNADGVTYNDGGTQTAITDTKSLAALDAILKAGDQYILSTEFQTFGGRDGKPVVEITFRPEMKSNDKTVVNGVPLADWANKGSIKIEIDPNTKDPVLQNLLQTSSVGMYADMRTSRDQMYGSNSVQKAHGFDASVAPSNFVNGKATQFSIVGTAKLLDPNTGNLVPVKITKTDNTGQPTGELFTGEFSKMTPSQIMTLINEQYNKFYYTNLNNYRIYKTKHSDAPSFDEMMAKQ